MNSFFAAIGNAWTNLPPKGKTAVVFIGMGGLIFIAGCLYGKG